MPIITALLLLYASRRLHLGPRTHTIAYTGCAAVYHRAH